MPENKLVGWQPCFSNPECVSEAVKNICALLEKEPERKYISLGVNDIGCFCECENCRKADGGKTSSFMGYRDHSTIYYHWLNKVVSAVDEKYPGRLYGVVAYREVIRPPEFKLHPNIVPFITLDIHQELSPKRRTENHKLVEAWGQVARHIGIWEYFFMARDYSIPRLTPAIHADAFRFATSKNAGALFIETGSYSGDAVKRYLAYKLAFHPELEPWRIIQDWCDAAVGKKAGKFLKEYYESCEKFWTSDEVRQTSWFTPGTTYFKRGMMRSYLYALPDGKLEEWRSMMEKMLAAAKEDGNADQCYRAEKLFDFFKFHEAAAYGGGGGLIPVGGKFTGTGEVMAMLEKLPGAMEYSSGFHTVFQKIASDRFNGNFHTDNLSEYTRTGAIFFNALLPWRNNPAVREKGFATAARPDVGAELRNKLRDTLDFDRKKNLIPDLPDELEKKEWRISYKGVKVAIEQEDGKKRIKVLQPSPSTWLAARRLLPLESRKTYALEVKAWSPFGTESQMSSRIILGGGKEILSSSFEESSEFYKPCQGKRITMTLVANTPNNCRYGWAYVIWNGLGPDEFFFIESMKLVEIGTGVEAK
ncbi:MAG: hypothetical protein BWY31_01730 [Lentisphaerae bacterium ADurb.Bin242]|nr:MAG: hypothetical protein BWY31_01730 [Lentisphaerae bacterium ADurb.Bin242]